jgi:hypothetical protein
MEEGRLLRAAIREVVVVLYVVNTARRRRPSPGLRPPSPRKRGEGQHARASRFVAPSAVARGRCSPGLQEHCLRKRRAYGTSIEICCPPQQSRGDTTRPSGRPCSQAGRRATRQEHRDLLPFSPPRGEKVPEGRMRGRSESRELCYTTIDRVTNYHFGGEGIFRQKLVGDAHDFDTARTQVECSLCVVLAVPFGFVMATVDFDRESQLGAIEVDNEAIDRNLPAEFVSAEGAVP